MTVLSWSGVVVMWWSLALGAAQARDPLETARRVEAEAHRLERAGQTAEASALLTEAGWITRWEVLGPMPLSAEAATPCLEHMAIWPGRDHSVAWHPAGPGRSGRRSPGRLSPGRLSPGRWLDRPQAGRVYARATLKGQGPLALRLRVDAPFQAFVDGQKVSEGEGEAAALITLNGQATLCIALEHVQREASIVGRLTRPDGGRAEAPVQGQGPWIIASEEASRLASARADGQPQTTPDTKRSPMHPKVEAAARWAQAGLPELGQAPLLALMEAGTLSDSEASARLVAARAPEQAIQAARRALDQDALDSRAHQALIAAYQQQGDTRSALLAMARRRGALGPDAPGVVEEMQALMAADAAPLALALGEQVSPWLSESAAVHEARGRASWLSGQKKKAISAWQRAAALGGPAGASASARLKAVLPGAPQGALSLDPELISLLRAAPAAGGLLLDERRVELTEAGQGRTWRRRVHRAGPQGAELSLELTTSHTERLGEVVAWRGTPGEMRRWLVPTAHSRRPRHLSVRLQPGEALVISWPAEAPAAPRWPGRLAAWTHQPQRLAGGGRWSFEISAPMDLPLFAQAAHVEVAGPLIRDNRRIWRWSGRSWRPGIRPKIRVGTAPDMGAVLRALVTSLDTPPSDAVKAWAQGWPKPLEAAVLHARADLTCTDERPDGRHGAAILAQGGGSAWAVAATLAEGLRALGHEAVVAPARGLWRGPAPDGPVDLTAFDRVLVAMGDRLIDPCAESRNLTRPLPEGGWAWPLRPGQAPQTVQIEPAEPETTTVRASMELAASEGGLIWSWRSQSRSEDSPLEVTEASIKARYPEARVISQPQEEGAPWTLWLPLTHLSRCAMPVTPPFSLKANPAPFVLEVEANIQAEREMIRMPPRDGAATEGVQVEQRTRRAGRSLTVSRTVRAGWSETSGTPPPDALQTALDPGCQAREAPTPAQDQEAP